MSTSQLTRFLAALAAAGLLAAGIPALAGASYSWPVKPFDQPHPVRGSFGDPRTIFSAPPTLRGLLSGACQCSFHEGVDISARDGTAVYPVEDGVVDVVRTARAREMIEVRSSGGAVFQYWHLLAAVRIGQQVQARRTVLGHILHEAGHVHLTELDGGTIVNPLQPGHLTPYRDTTRPSVGAVSFVGSAGGPLLSTLVRGRVEIDAEAYDSPAIPVPGLWNGMPVTPARVAWQIETWTGKPTGLVGVAYDVRHTIPPDADFWHVYARGTFQNMSVFGKHYSWLEPGRFVFRLTPAGLDTTRLKDGVYVVVVTASDIADNVAVERVRFTVANGPPE